MVFKKLEKISRKTKRTGTNKVENEKIYFNIPYETNGLAKATHCGYDPEKKLWFTGCDNTNIVVLIKRYGINENTSENAMKLLEETLKLKNKQ